LISVVKKLLCSGLLVSAVLSSRIFGECVPKPNSTKREVFSSVVTQPERLNSPAGLIANPAGIEISLKERAEEVLAILLDYEGTSAPIETKLKGTIRESKTGCNVHLVGHNKRGKVEIHGTLTGANFQATIVRQIGKETYSETVMIRRKPPDVNQTEIVAG